jgi:hypothetical protein
VVLGLVHYAQFVQLPGSLFQGHVDWILFNDGDIFQFQGRIVMGELVQGRSKYTDEDRRKAVVEYCVSGVMTKVSDATGIPDTTLCTWKNKSDWWDDLVATVRSEIDEQLQPGLGREY